MAKNDGAERQALEQALRTGRVRGVYLLHGQEENLEAEALAGIRRAVLGDGMAELNESVLTNPDAEELISACETMPFLSERRLVLVRDADGFSGAKNAAEGIVEYLDRVPDSCVLVFLVTGTADSRKALPKKIALCGHAVNFEVLKNSPEVGRWVCDAFAQQGKRCAPSVASQLIFLSGDDTSRLRGEVGKISAYVGQREEITSADVLACASRTAEYRVFDLTESAAAGRDAQALQQLRALQRDGADDLYLLAMLLRQYRQLQQVKVLEYSKTPRQEWGKRLGIGSDYALNRLIQQASQMSASLPRKAVNI